MALDSLNQTTNANAAAEFLKCCGSTSWAAAMTAARPYATLAELLTKADEVWWSLTEDDWREAFRAHPKIGEKKAATAQSAQAQNWSAQEQAGVAQAPVAVIEELAERNRQYQERFGFIFIVCATGKSSAEMLSIINSRIANEPAAEIRTAAEEQRKITRLRLEKLINQ